MEPVREGLPLGGTAGRGGGEGHPHLTSWPIHLPRRWFSIQNSQLVYQKKLKVRSGPCPTWARPTWALGGLVSGICTGLRTLLGTTA